MPRGLLHSAMTGAVIVLGKHMVRLWVRTPVILTDVFMVFFFIFLPSRKITGQKFGQKTTASF